MVLGVGVGCGDDPVEDLGIDEAARVLRDVGGRDMTANHVEQPPHPGPTVRLVLLRGPDPEALAHVLLVDAHVGLAVADAVVALDHQGGLILEPLRRHGGDHEADQGGRPHAHVLVDVVVREPGDGGLDDVARGPGAVGPKPHAVRGPHECGLRLRPGQREPAIHAGARPPGRVGAHSPKEVGDLRLRHRFRPPAGSVAAAGSGLNTTAPGTSSPRGVPSRSNGVLRARIARPASAHLVVGQEPVQPRLEWRSRQRFGGDGGENRQRRGVEGVRRRVAPPEPPAVARERAGEPPGPRDRVEVASAQKVFDRRHHKMSLSPDIAPVSSYDDNRDGTRARPRRAGKRLGARRVPET